MTTLVDLFDSSEKRRRLSHIKNLMVLAASDGFIDKSEIELIFAVGFRYGLSRQELNRIIKRPKSISFKAPEYFRQRVEQLYDMVCVMMVDGEIHERELIFCKAVAIKLGFEHEIIEAIVSDVIDSIAQGLAVEIILAEMMNKYA